MALVCRSTLSLTRTANFDRIARPYRLLEHLTLGRALTRARLTYLSALTHTRHALVLGDGDGRALAALLRTNPQVHATAIDSSRTMLRLLTQRCTFASTRLSTLHAGASTALAALPPPTFDLVTTHFFLDCFSPADLARLIPAIRARLAPGALWVVSDFRIPPAGPLRLPARILVRLLYLAFRLITGLQPTSLPDYATLLRESGLSPLRIRHSLAGLLTAELWQLPPVGHSSPANPR